VRVVVEVFLNNQINVLNVKAANTI